MPFPSPNLYQQSPALDEHILPPPAVHIPADKPVSTADSHRSASPARPISNIGLQYQSIREDAEDTAEQVNTEQWQPSELEAGRLVRIAQQTGGNSSVCVFCLATRDVCIELGMNDVPTLFNTFGQGEFGSPFGLVGCMLGY